VGRLFARAAALAVLVGVSAPGTAAAYEFDVRAITYGQLNSRTQLRPSASNTGLARRRFSQTLSLDIWDITGNRRGLGLYDAKPKDRNAPDVYFTSFMRVDHDFGEFTRDDIVFSGQTFDAIDLIPELAAQSLGLEILWAVAGVRGLGGFLDIEVGRQLRVDQLDWWSFDGASVKAHLPASLAVEVFGGLRTRDSSFLGSSVLDPDGTGNAECAEYVEGATPGTGEWRPIPIPGPGSDGFRADAFECPQREELMPTFGAAVETDGLPVVARLSYRRSVSRSPGIIGPVDRFTNPDVGYYPNDFGEAPEWGVNEERVSLAASTTFKIGDGDGHWSPFAAVRYSILHNWFDEGHLGARIKLGSHGLTPEYYYSFPTFDGDSIFNIFSVSGYHDMRLTYDLSPSRADWSTYVRGWARFFNSGDAMDDPDADGVEPAGGINVGGRKQLYADIFGRVDLFYEDGFGGRRAGGFAYGRWRVIAPLVLMTRLSSITYSEDSLPGLDGTSLGAQLGATYRFVPGVALSVTGEQNVRVTDDNPWQDRNNFQLFAVLDLAFVPEL